MGPTVSCWIFQFIFWLVHVVQAHVRLCHDMIGRSIWGGTILGPAGRYGMVQSYDRPVDLGWYNGEIGRSIRDGTML